MGLAETMCIEGMRMTGVKDGSYSFLPKIWGEMISSPLTWYLIST